ncbi:MAG: Jag N-terminal domain-containing protein [Candidatus Omnitrophota bacterium]|jgi:spoIIIJ-associated protein
MNKESDKKGIEFYGRTVEESIQNAIKELNVPRESLNIKVVSEEKKGLFGMEGEKPAKIIASFKKKSNILSKKQN